MKILGFISATVILFPGNANWSTIFCLQQKNDFFSQGAFFQTLLL